VAFTPQLTGISLTRADPAPVEKLRANANAQHS
jgi:hypothetical protein